MFASVAVSAEVYAVRFALKRSAYANIEVHDSSLRLRVLRSLHFRSYRLGYVLQIREALFLAVQSPVRVCIAQSAASATRHAGVSRDVACRVQKRETLLRMRIKLVNLALFLLSPLPFSV